MFKIGDEVTVKDNGAVFSTYDRWVKKNFSDYSPLFKKEYSPDNGLQGIVVGSGKHDTICSYGTLYLIQTKENKVFIIEENGLEKSEEFEAKSGMIAIMSDGEERLILEFGGELVVARPGYFFPYKERNSPGRTKHIIAIKALPNNRSVCNFLDGKEYEATVVWQAENPEKKKLQEVVEKLQRELEEAQEKLKNLN